MLQKENIISPFDETFIEVTNNFTSIGGLVVKLAVAIHLRTVSASPGFDSRPMHFLLLCGDRGVGDRRYFCESRARCKRANVGEPSFIEQEHGPSPGGLHIFHSL